MNTIFRNSGNSKTSDLHRILLNLSDKIHLTLIRLGFLRETFSEGGSI